MTTRLAGTRKICGGSDTHSSWSLLISNVVTVIVSTLIAQCLADKGTTQLVDETE